jgi:RND family efflux transporter MFP subunit
MFMKWLTGSSFKKKAIIGLSLMLVLSGCSLLPNERDEEVLPDIVPPQISQKPEYTVTTKTLETKVTVMGKLISLKEEPLYFNVGDKFVDEVNVKNGDYVEQGTIIAKLDVKDLEKQLRLDKINFQSDERKMKELLRTKDQLEPGEFEQQRITFEEKRQKLVDLQEEINEATIVAPFSGTVVSLSVQKGDRSTAYKTIAIVADTSQMVPAVKLTKNDLEKVSIGMETTVTISNVGSYKGKVKALPVQKSDSNENPNNPQNPENSIERVEDFVIIELEKPLDASLNRGTPSNVSIVVNRIENAIVIPPSALRSIGNRTYVQVVDENGKREVDVEVGQQTSTEVEIKQGLTVGQKVVGR